VPEIELGANGIWNESNSIYIWIWQLAETWSSILTHSKASSLGWIRDGDSTLQQLWILNCCATTMDTKLLWIPNSNVRIKIITFLCGFCSILQSPPLLHSYYVLLIGTDVLLIFLVFILIICFWRASDMGWCASDMSCHCSAVRVVKKPSRRWDTVDRVGCVSAVRYNEPTMNKVR